MTNDQLAVLAKELVGTKLNIHATSYKFFKLPTVAEGDWVRLEQVGKVFRCDDCRTWWPIDDRVADDVDQCKGCSR